MYATTCCVLALCLGIEGPAVLQAQPTLSGRVVDSSAEPVSGARVDISTAAPLRGRGSFCPSCYLDCRKSATTNSEGEFEIPRLSGKLKFRLLVTMPGYKPHQTDLLDPRLEQPHIVLDHQETDWPPERTLRGSVVNKQGLPVEGALVDPHGVRLGNTQRWGAINVETTVTDSDGNFALFVPEEYGGLSVRVMADGYCGATTEMWEPGKSYEVRVPVGASVTGRIVHDGNPVAGLDVAVVQLNRFTTHHFIKAVPATTDELGRFRIDYLPPDEMYVIYTIVGDGDGDVVLRTSEFRAALDGKLTDLGPLSVEPALRLSGRIQLPEGLAMPADARLALLRDPAWDLVSTEIAADGSFSIGGLPAETYNVYLTAEGIILDREKLGPREWKRIGFSLSLQESVDQLLLPVLPADP
jgi:uncharacterized GH25 family protein